MDADILSGLLRDDYEKPTACSKCGKSLKYIGIGEYECESCGAREFDDYGRVRAFIESHPGANGLQVEKATGVSRKVIKGLVDSGKLDISKGSFGTMGGK